MEHGAKKQLGFDDLLQLPIDMDPLFCHDYLLNCWEDQTRRDCSHPSLFWTICYAYGWPYMCLGLLKVLLEIIYQLLSRLWNRKKKNKEDKFKVKLVK